MRSNILKKRRSDERNGVFEISECVKRDMDVPNVVAGAQLTSTYLFVGFFSLSRILPSTAKQTRFMKTA